MAELILTLVRHGETAGQSSLRYYGRTDVPLSPLGRAQMARVRRALGDPQFAAVYASALSRAVEAAMIVAATTHVIRVADFNEIDFGDWEGLTAEEIQARDPEGFGRWMAKRGDFAYPGGECTVALRARVRHALQGVLAQAPSGNLLLVLHKGVIRCILSELLCWEEHQRQALALALASIHVVTCDRGQWHAEMLDRTDHL